MAPSSSRILDCTRRAINSIDLPGDLSPSPVGLRAQDCQAGFEIRRLDIGRQTPLKSRAQPLFQRHQRLGRAVG